MLRKRSHREGLFVAHERDEGEQFPQILNERETEVLQLFVVAAVDRDHDELRDREQKDDVNDEPRNEAVAN